jgi:exopolysaccharide production protein ExoY
MATIKSMSWLVFLELRRMHPVSAKVHPVTANSRISRTPAPKLVSTAEIAVESSTVLVDFSVEHAIKRFVDVIGAVVLGLIFAPLTVLILVVATWSGVSPMFRHERVGKDGKSFGCLKFRTMVPDAQQRLDELLQSDPALREEWERDQKLKNDPRVTRLGRLLRGTSLDELPQLWNVIRGDMSLVGPRPVTREELLRYGRNSVIYMMVRPGVTGFWQVNGRSNAEYRRRVAMDVCYIRNQSLVLDLWIMFRTIFIVIGRRGAY